MAIGLVFGLRRTLPDPGSTHGRFMTGARMAIIRDRLKNEGRPTHRIGLYDVTALADLEGHGSRRAQRTG